MATDELYLDNLDEYINDENKIVTYKWLSCTLGVHVNQAKQMLYAFTKQQRNEKDNDQLSVTYFVAGIQTDKEGTKSQCVQIVPEEKLEAIKNRLQPVTSCHIYSVQKAKLKDSNALYQADYDLLKENIFQSNKFSAITCPTAKIRNTDDLVRLQQRSNPVQEESHVSVKKTEHQNGHSSDKSKSEAKKKGGIAGMFAAQASNKKEATQTADTASKQNEQKAAAKAKPKVGALESMFAKQATKPKAVVKPVVKKEEIVESKKEEEKIKTKPVETVKGKKKKTVESDEDDTNKQMKKRRRIRDMFDSSSDEEEMEESPVPSPRAIQEAENPLVESFVPDTPEVKERLKPESKDQVKPTIEEDDRDDFKEEKTSLKVSPTVTNGSKRRRIRKKKQVSKTFLDDEGFMVTEKVMESDSTDASELDEPVKPAPKQNTQKKAMAETKKSPTKKKVSPKSTAGGKQTSLMSFFKKK